AVGELTDKSDVIDPLVAKMGRIVIKTKTFMVTHGFQRPFGGGNIESDFGGVDFQGKVHIFRFKNVQNRNPTPGEILKSLLEIGLTGGWKRIEGMPDGR